jgi:predicted N-acetyltransferase YhbS/uncharacterized protein YdhG (YjbR/CyaY superfamily)
LKFSLRRERAADRDRVERITYRAFLTAPHAGGDEALLARKLRSRDAFVPELDLVAELDGGVVGNIMYTKSRVVGEGGEWGTLTFGPVSVLPKHQRRGIGSALINETLVIAGRMGFRAVLIFGHDGYYPRFGFRDAAEYGISTEDGKNFPAFMALPLYDGALEGVHGRLICDEVYTTLDKAESTALNAKLAEPMDIDEYIAAQPKAVRPLLQAVRETIRGAVPEATERISWQMPTFWQRRNIVHFASFKRHIGLFPGSEAISAFADRLVGYKTSKGSIRFPLDRPIDHALIADITRWRTRHS